MTVEPQKPATPKTALGVQLERIKTQIAKTAEVMGRQTEIIRADGPRHKRLSKADKVRISEK